MKSHWIKRIVRLLVLLFGVSILCFILTALSSTDPATYLVRRGNLSPTPEVIEQVRAELGLDQPLPIRYFELDRRCLSRRLWGIYFFNKRGGCGFGSLLPANAAISFSVVS